jgi:hopanoid C-3 methylase HpnR
MVDDVAFVQERHGMEIAEAIIRAGSRKKYYLETRSDVLLRNKDVFRFWRKLGLEYMFIGLEAIDEEGLRKHRKRVSLGRNFEALEYARSLGIMIAINLIADPDWDHERFRIVREWGVELPEVVNISVNTPYPGTESWIAEGDRVASRDYRLYDIQHTVLPTRLPLAEFYGELVATQRAFYRKHLGWRRVMNTAGVIAGHLMHGQTNFLRSLFHLDRVFRPEFLLADHALPVEYQIPLPQSSAAGPAAPRSALYIHPPRGRKGRAIDSATERFVEDTRMGITP